MSRFEKGYFSGTLPWCRLSAYILGGGAYASLKTVTLNSITEGFMCVWHGPSSAQQYVDACSAVL